MTKDDVNWRCTDFSKSPFFKPNHIACVYAKPYMPQTIVILDKESGDVKVWNPKECVSKKNGYVDCQII